MSALYRLKAYFGMVPAEELDDYGPHYGPDYGDDSDDRAYPPERPQARRSRRSGLDEDDAAAGNGRPDDGYPEAEVPGIRSVRRGGWAARPDTAPVRGSLAVDAAAPPLREPVREPVSRSDPHAEEVGYPMSRIVTLHPRNYNEARPIGERYREGTPVIMNLTGMDDADAKRLVDFAAGLAFALRGSIDKVTSKVFLISPASVGVSAEDKRRIAEGGLFNESGVHPRSD